MTSRKLDQLYRQVIMDHYKNPRNNGELPDSDVTIDLNNPTCGDQIHLHLKWMVIKSLRQNSLVAAVRFRWPLLR